MYCRIYNRNETQLKVGSELLWLWLAIEPTKDKEILSITISKEKSMFVAERFLIKSFKRIWLSFCFNRDGGIWYPPQACQLLKLNHHLHSPFEKSIITEPSECLNSY